MRPPEIYTATTTPYADDGSVDLEAFRAGLRRIRPFVDGAFVCGTMGEFPALDDAERTALVTAAVEELGPERTIAHIGAVSTRQTLRLADAAVESGATRIAAITPYYLPASVSAVAAHYAELRSAHPGVELYGYLFPDVAVTDVLPSGLGALVDAGVDGIKTSGLASTRVADYLAAAPDGFSLWSGNDADLPAVLAAGGRGVVSGVSGALPEVYAEYRDAVVADDGPGADAAHERIVRAVALIGPSLRHTKLAIDLRGGAGGVTRMSVDPVDEAAAARIRDLLAG